MIPAIILREMLYRWINQSIGLKLDFAVAKEVLNLSKRYGSADVSVSLTICEEWDLIKVGTEFRLNRRFRKNLNQAQTFQIMLNGVFCNITHSPAIRVFPRSHIENSSLHGIDLQLPGALFEDRVSFHFRYPMPADKIHYGNDRFLKLNDFFRIRNIPVHMRDRVPILLIKSSVFDGIAAVFLPNNTTIMANTSSFFLFQDTSNTVVLNFKLLNTFYENIHSFHE
jgi:hypothetical protein